jgi:methionyl-tRNA formyltransferase
MKLSKKHIVIATTKAWNIVRARTWRAARKSLFNVTIITKPEDLRYERLKKINPDYVFFPHWSWIIPEDIYRNFACVVFHMTDVPFGRGGSPLQNLLVRGIRKTKISAIRVTRVIDAGPIYCKLPLSLNGSAQEIYERASRAIFETMIPDIIEHDPMPVAQRGVATVFKRRCPAQSRIPGASTLEQAYDYIRMMDAEGYPRAFIESQSLRFEFSKAVRNHGSITAVVTITQKGKR